MNRNSSNDTDSSNTGSNDELTPATTPATEPSTATEPSADTDATPRTPASSSTEKTSTEKTPTTEDSTEDTEEPASEPVTTDATKDEDKDATKVTFTIVFDDDPGATATDGSDAEEPQGDTATVTITPSHPDSDEDSDADVDDDGAAADNVTDGTGTDDTDDEDGDEDDENDDDQTPVNPLAVDRGKDVATKDGNRAEDDVLLRSYPTFSLRDVVLTNKSTGRHVLDDVSLSFYSGNLYAIGVDEGDTEQHEAVLSVVCGLKRPTSGSVMMKSANLAELDPTEIRGHRLGVVTRRYLLRDDLTAVDNIVYAMDASNRTFLKPKKTIAHELLTRAGFDGATSDPDGKNPSRYVPVRELNPFARILTAIARSISCDAEVLILDEPTTGLQPEESTAVLDLLRSLAHDREPRCVIVVTADDDVLDATDDQKYLD